MITLKRVKQFVKDLNSDITIWQPSTPPAPQVQQRNEAKLMVTKPHKRSFIDTGHLTNDTTTEKENITALYLYITHWENMIHQITNLQR